MTKWDHLIHRRPLEEFRTTGETRIPEVGEWFRSIEPKSAEQLIDGPTGKNFTPEILTWIYNGEEGVLTYYEAGYYDGLQNYSPNIPSYNDNWPEYDSGYVDGLGTFLLQIEEIDEG